MSGLNKVLLIGHVGAKPEMRQTSGGEAVARLRIATSSTRQKDGVEEKETEWHDVVAFGKLAEQCNEYVDKGRLVYVEGRMSSHSWEDKAGSKRLTREVIARRVDFLGAKPAKAA